MTDLDLTNLKQIAQNATQGEWSIEPSTVRYLDGRTAPTHEIVCTRQSQADPSDTDWETVIDDVESEPDAAHIATFDPPTALALIARIEQAEHRAKRYKALAETRLETIQRVRDLHVPADVCTNFQHTRPGTMCPDCYIFCASCQQHYPCRTIQTLEGDPG